MFHVDMACSDFGKKNWHQSKTSSLTWYPKEWSCLLFQDISGLIDISTACLQCAVLIYPSFELVLLNISYVLVLCLERQVPAVYSNLFHSTSPSSLWDFSSILPVSYTMSCVKRGTLGNRPHHRLQIAVCVGIIFLSSLCSKGEFLNLGNDSSLLGIEVHQTGTFDAIKPSNWLKKVRL